MSTTYVLTHNHSAYGAVITHDIMIGIEYANMYPFRGCMCKSFMNDIEAYNYMCYKLAELRWHENPDRLHPMPDMKMMMEYGCFVDEAQLRHIPPWTIKQDRYFAVITIDFNSALLDNISNLAGYVRAYNGHPIMFEEFTDVVSAKNWLAENICIPLRARGAYIQPLSPIVIPNVGESIHGPTYTLLNDIPAMDNAQFLYQGDDGNEKFL